MTSKTRKTIRDVSWQGKRAILRVDFNVPFDWATRLISDDARIKAAVPTIDYLREHGASVVICTHLGRPGGQHESHLELQPVVKRLSEFLNIPIQYLHDCVGEIAQSKTKMLNPGEVIVLENLRFFPGEEDNDPNFARGLAQLGDVFVNDAFGTAHRAHASTEGITQHLPSVSGFLMEREISMLTEVLEKPTRPIAVLLGGAKVADKVGVLKKLVAHADALLIGGGMAGTFLSAKGYAVGNSLVEKERIQFCHDIIERTEQLGVELHLPIDVVISERIEPSAERLVVDVNAIPADSAITDIGPKTTKQFISVLSRMRTIVWNGPMGVYEMPAFRQGTEEIAFALASSPSETIIGGGSTSDAVTDLNLAERMTHVSTGGGATLEFLEGKLLPGVVALDNH